jgi:hypothetical protein
MERIKLNKDIKVVYVNARSFPEGILEAHQTLHSMIPFSRERKYFGISRPEQNQGIVYRAAAEELAPGEGEKLQLNTLLIRAGEYICITIEDYTKDLLSIDRAFKELLDYPNLDPQGYCVEWYINEKDVKCMIRLKD